MATQQGFIHGFQNQNHFAQHNEQYCSAQQLLCDCFDTELTFFAWLFFYRISLVEPGPVVTSFISNLKGMASKVDLSTADQKSIKLMQSVIARMTDLTASCGQKSEEIADTIKEILLSSKPHIRYLTNKHYGIEEATSKLSDLTGDKLVEVLEKQFFNDQRFSFIGLPEMLTSQNEACCRLI